MRAHDWADVWNLFLDWVSHRNIPAQIAIGLGAVFVAVMALEGIRASFFPKQIVKGVALRDAAPPPMKPVEFVASEEPQAIWNDGELSPITVNSEAARRSGPQPLRIIGQRKPS